MESLMTTESQNVRNILALGSANGMAALAKAYANSGKSPDEFRLAVKKSRGKVTEPEASGFSNDVRAEFSRDVSKYGYSVLNYVRSLIDPGRFRDHAVLECEIAAEAQRLAAADGRVSRGVGTVPWEALSQRDLTVGTATAGGHLKGTDHLGGAFVDALRPSSVVMDLGARVMSNLRGDVAIPALNDKTSAYWLAENGAPTEGAPTFRQITMSPKTVGAYVDFSRKLMLQSDPSIDSIVTHDLKQQLATAIDTVAINGGGSNEPSGILQTAGIGSVALGTNGGPPTWTSVTDLYNEVEVDNAAEGRLGYLTTPQAKAKMANTSKVSSTDSRMVLDEPWSNLLGVPFRSNTLVPSDLTKGTSSGVCSAMIFGNFNDLLIGSWSGIDINIDDKTLSTTGGVRIVAFTDVDVSLRHAESFAAILDMTTT
jgi:HK97 family phage major capsid protein